MKPQRKRNKKEKKQEKKQIFRVTCGEEKHQLRMWRGRLHPVDHTVDDLKAQDVLATFGAKPCRCLEIMYDWRKACQRGYSADLSKGLERLASAAHDVGCDRRSRWEENEKPTRMLELRERNMRRSTNDLADAAHLVERELMTGGCDYGHLSEVSIRCVGDDLVGAGLLPRRGKDTDPLLALSVSSRWLRHVYRNGFSVVQGMAVLDVITVDMLVWYMTLTNEARQSMIDDMQHLAKQSLGVKYWWLYTLEYCLDRKEALKNWNSLAPTVLVAYPSRELGVLAATPMLLSRKDEGRFRLINANPKNNNLYRG